MLLSPHCPSFLPSCLSIRFTFRCTCIFSSAMQQFSDFLLSLVQPGDCSRFKYLMKEIRHSSSSSSSSSSSPTWAHIVNRCKDWEWRRLKRFLYSSSSSSARWMNGNPPTNDSVISFVHCRLVASRPHPRRHHRWTKWLSIHAAVSTASLQNLFSRFARARFHSNNMKPINSNRNLTASCYIVSHLSTSRLFFSPSPSLNSLFFFIIQIGWMGRFINQLTM